MMKLRFIQTILCIITFCLTFAKLSLAASLEEIIEYFQNPDDDYVMVVAHRANGGEYPENSLPAIEEAIAIGVDMIEVDVRRTRDCHFVLMHDGSVNRTTNGSGRVINKSLAEIKQLRLLGKNKKTTNYEVPTLKEALLAVKGKIMINLDKLNISSLQDIIPILQETETLSQVVFKGRYTVQALRRKLGDAVNEITYMPIIQGKTLNDKENFINNFEREINPTAYEAVFRRYSDDVYSYIEKVKENSDNVWINTLGRGQYSGVRNDKKALSNPDANWGWVIDKGATIIQTDYPRELIEYLITKGKH